MLPDKTSSGLWAVPVTKAVDMVNNWQFDNGFDQWSHTTNWMWHGFEETDGNDTWVRWGWGDGLGIWQTCGIYEADTVYTLGVRAKNYDGGMEGIKLIFEDVNDGGVTTRLIEDEQWFLYGNTNPGPDPIPPVI